MTEQIHEYRLGKLEEDLKIVSSDISAINKNIAVISTAIDKISYTLEKIEKVEIDNKHLSKQIEEIDKELSKIKERQNLFMGGVLVISFVIGVAVKIFF